MAFRSRRCPICMIVPPYMLEKLAQHDNAEVRERALATLQVMTRAHSLRAAQSRTLTVGAALAATNAGRTRRVFDCQNTSDLTRALVRQEGGKATKDSAVDEAYDHAGTTWDFFMKQFKRNSIDGRGMTIVSSVHYSENGRGFDNAFWDGRQMVYGDGDELFGRMTKNLDVVAHELTHGVIQESAGLPYENQSGALNEHFADVFGVVVRQWAEKDRDPDKANWLVGDGLLLSGDALRSMKAPGTANPEDPQPAHMKDYVRLPNTRAGDWGGVHYNSGIPNRAFHLAATAIGKPSWEVAARIWYRTLTERLKGPADFAKCAYETVSVARDYHDDVTARRVEEAWVEVGVIKPNIGPGASLAGATEKKKSGPRAQTMKRVSLVARGKGKKSV